MTWELCEFQSESVGVMPSVNVGHLSLLLLEAIAIVSSHYESVEFDLTPGRVRGLRIRSAHNKEALAFLGIPYATPPYDRLRFRVIQFIHKKHSKSEFHCWSATCCPSGLGGSTGRHKLPLDVSTVRLAKQSNGERRLSIPQRLYTSF